MRVSEKTRWSTADEINFLRGLAQERKWDALRSLKQIYRKRSWEGRHMSVMATQVAEELEVLLSTAPLFETQLVPEKSLTTTTPSPIAK